MKILAFETSAKPSSICVIENNVILASSLVNNKLTHSQTLMTLCEDMLKNSKININDIDAFAVSNGPGSFTGLRIGIGAVKGLAFALNKPCLSISSLEGLAYNLLGFNGIICTIQDARCNQLYFSVFDCNGKSITKLFSEKSINIEDINNILINLKNKNIFLVGDGVSLCYNNIKDKFSNLFIAPYHLNFPNAIGIALSAVNKAKNNEFISYCDLKPEYLMLPQAQKDFIKKNNKEDF